MNNFLAKAGPDGGLETGFGVISHSRLCSAIFISCLLGCLFVIAHPAWAQEAKSDKQPIPLDDILIFTEVFDKIKKEYVDGAEDKELLRNAIHGMLSGLDPHSNFLEPDAYTDIRISTEGRFGGLGIEVTVDSGLLRIVTPIDGTPAADADIQSGDIIVMIDGAPVRGVNLQDAIDKLRGQPGTKIVLTISRKGTADVFDVSLIRAIIKVTSVRGEILEPGFGYARISNFQEATARNLKTQIEKLHKASGDEGLYGLVLDLRNNPGGVLNGAIEVSDLFLEEGGIVSTRGKNDAEDASYDAKPGDALNNAPLVVLVNGGSASASEIVAGALQDHNRAIVMGTKTFGKGSVQTVIPMNNGGALKLTTARYFTPLNRSIQAKGIEPDITVEQTEYSAKADKRKQVRERDLAGHLEGDVEQNNNDDESVPAENDSPAEKSKRSALLDRDFQVGEALNMLKGMSLVQRRLESN